MGDGGGGPDHMGSAHSRGGQRLRGGGGARERQGGVESKLTLWAVRTAEEARDSRGLMGTGARFMICLNKP